MKKAEFKKLIKEVLEEEDSVNLSPLEKMKHVLVIFNKISEKYDVEIAPYPDRMDALNKFMDEMAQLIDKYW